jgi:hypothetical protein
MVEARTREGGGVMDGIEMSIAAPHGAPLEWWEDAIRARVRAEIEAAISPLADAAPGMLEEGADLYRFVTAEIVLPAGERLRLTASIEVIE